MRYEVNDKNQAKNKNKYMIFFNNHPHQNHKKGTDDVKSDKRRTECQDVVKL